MRRASALAARLFSRRLRASERAIRSMPCSFFLFFICSAPFTNSVV